MRTDIIHTRIFKIPHLVVREQSDGSGRPKLTLFRLDGKQIENDGKCPAAIARQIRARMRGE